MVKIWSDENVKLLIRTIRDYEHIWNTRHPRYTLNKRTRHDLWKEIADLVNQASIEFEFKPAELCSKWNNLRLCFQKEAERVLKLRLNGSRWKYYDMLTFLMDHPMKKHDALQPASKRYSLRRIQLKRETVDETEVVSVGSMSPVKSQADQKRVESFSAGVGEIIPVHKQGRSGLETSFGDYVAAEMRRLELDLQIRAKKVIFDVLIELQYEQESRSRCT